MKKLMDSHLQLGRELKSKWEGGEGSEDEEMDAGEMVEVGSSVEHLIDPSSTFSLRKTRPSSPPPLLRQQAHLPGNSPPPSILPTRSFAVPSRSCARSRARP